MPDHEQATGLTRQVLGGQACLPHETVRYRRDGTLGGRHRRRIADLCRGGDGRHRGRLYRHHRAQAGREQALQELNVTLEDRVQQRTFELQVLHELSQEIGYTLSYDDLFRLILQHLHRVCEYDIAGSLLVSGDQWQVFVRQTRPTDDRLLAEVQEQSSPDLRAAGRHRAARDRDRT